MKPYDTKAIAIAVGIPYESAEGQFFPDTYYFSRNTTDIEILKRAYKAMQKKLNYEWAHRSEEVPYKIAMKLSQWLLLLKKKQASQ